MSKKLSILESRSVNSISVTVGVTFEWCDLDDRDAARLFFDMCDRFGVTGHKEDKTFDERPVG